MWVGLEMVVEARVEEGREDRIQLRIGILRWRRSVVAVRAAIVEIRRKSMKGEKMGSSWGRGVEIGLRHSIGA